VHERDAELWSIHAGGDGPSTIKVKRKSNSAKNERKRRSTRGGQLGCEESVRGVRPTSRGSLAEAPKK